MAARARPPVAKDEDEESSEEELKDELFDLLDTIPKRGFEASEDDKADVLEIIAELEERPSPTLSPSPLTLTTHHSPLNLHPDPDLGPGPGLEPNTLALASDPNPSLDRGPDPGPGPGSGRGRGRGPEQGMEGGDACADYSNSPLLSGTFTLLFCSSKTFHTNQVALRGCNPGPGPGPHPSPHTNQGLMACLRMSMCICIHTLHPGADGVQRGHGGRVHARAADEADA